MEILELELKHFGKFQEQKIKFHPGVNIIYGGNETGKSTIHAFIRAMFFGIAKSRGKAGKKDEYQLRQPWDHPSYFAGTMRVCYGGRNYRIERNFNKNEQDVRLICETSGEELSMEEGELSGLLAGMSEAAFRNTVFIAQAGCETDAALAEVLQKFMVNFQETGDGNLDISRALERLKGQKKQAETKKKQKQELLDEKIARKQTEIEYVKRELEQKQAALHKGKLEAGSLRQKEQEGQKASTLGNKGRQLEKPIFSGDTECEGDIGRFWFWVKLLLLIGGLLGIACGIFAETLWMRFGMFLLGGSFFVLSGWLAWADFSGRSPFFDGKMVSRDYRGSTEEAEGSQIRETMRMEEEQTLRKQNQQLEEGKRRWEREEQKRVILEKEVQLEALRQELEEVYDEREALAVYEQEKAALDLAMTRIKELSAKIYREAGSEFNRIASEILTDLTEGRYTMLTLNEKMEVQVSTPSRLLQLHQVSYGTMHQIYFALRMAAGNLLSGGRPVPILLDEAFAMYDDERLEAALRWLDGCGRQVILFSCQTREKIILDHIHQENGKRA